jgi:hypothetical protein
VWWDSRACGATNDSLAFSVSDLGMAMLAAPVGEGGEGGGGVLRWALPEGYCLLGDDAYKGVPKHRMVVPYPGAGLEEDIDTTNYFISLGRTVIEQAFGRFVQRFGLMARTMRLSPDKAILCTGAALRLHNFCNAYGFDTFNCHVPTLLTSEEVARDHAVQHTSRHAGGRHAGGRTFDARQPMLALVRANDLVRPQHSQHGRNM